MKLTGLNTIKGQDFDTVAPEMRESRGLALESAAEMSCVMHTSPNIHWALSEITHIGVFDGPLSSAWLARRPWCCYFKTC